MLATLLAVLASGLFWVAQPARVAGLVLDRAGDALGLDITASGVSEYRLRGTPTLVLRGLVAREPGAATALLTAERVYLSLPWSTLRARGADLTVQRVELDAPTLDLPALEDWRADRPPADEVRIPTLTDGLEVVDGKVIGDGWSVDRIALELASLRPDRAAAMRVGGRFRNHDTSVPFDLQVALSRISMDAGVGAAGLASVVTPEWRMPMDITLSGRLRSAGDSLGLDAFRLGADARYLGTGRELRFAYSLAGPVRYRNGRLRIEPLGLALRGEDLVPDLSAAGSFAWRDVMALQLDGSIAEWPGSWPALPAPLANADTPLPFKLEYSGPAGLSGTTTLQLRRDATRLDAVFRLSQVLDWLDGIATGTPLPPINGSMETPRLEIAGATLDGVRIEFDNDDGKDE